MINGLSGNLPLTPLPSAGDSVRDATPRAAGRDSGPVTSELKGIVRDMATAPPVDAGRVAELKAGMISGSYRLQPERIADAMIRSVTG